MLKLNHAVELRLYPNKLQQELINKTFGCVRKVYNLALAESIDSYNQTKLFNHSGYPTYIEQFPYLADVEKQALQQSLNDLKTALFITFKVCSSHNFTTFNIYPNKIFKNKGTTTLNDIIKFSTFIFSSKKLIILS